MVFASAALPSSVSVLYTAAEVKIVECVEEEWDAVTPMHSCQSGAARRSGTRSVCLRHCESRTQQLGSVEEHLRVARLATSRLGGMCSLELRYIRPVSLADHDIDAKRFHISLIVSTDGDGNTDWK